MSSQTIDEFLVSIGIDTKAYQDGVKALDEKLEKLQKKLEEGEEALKNVSKSSKGTAKNTKDTANEMQKFGASVRSAMSSLVRFFGVIATSSGLTKLTLNTAKTNDQINFLSKNLGMNRKELQHWGGMAEALGGTSDGMYSSFMNLKQGINALVMAGDTSLVPFFNAVGVSMVDLEGNARSVEEIMLDLADTFQGKKRDQAYHLASLMGFDNDTINVLLAGRSEMQRALKDQNSRVLSSDEDIENSRKFNENLSKMKQRFSDLTIVLGNQLIPMIGEFVIKLTEVFQYLAENEELTTSIFTGMSIAMGATLLPLITKVVSSFVGMGAGAVALVTNLNPVTAAVTALAGAFSFLYYDYNKWKKGEDSVGDWDYITKSFGSYTRTLKRDFNDLSNTLDEFFEKNKDIGDVFNTFLDWSGITNGINQIKVGFLDLSQSIKNSIMPVFAWLSGAVDAVLGAKWGEAWEIIAGGVDQFRGAQSEISGYGVPQNQWRSFEAEAVPVIGGGITKNSKSSDKEDFAVRTLMEMGYSKEAASGITANLVYESGINPQAMGPEVRKDDQGNVIEEYYSYGIAQWNKGRFDRLKKYLNENFQTTWDKSTEKQQLSFLDWELQSFYPEVHKELQRADITAEDASKVVTKKYERPANMDKVASERAPKATEIESRIMKALEENPVLYRKAIDSQPKSFEDQLNNARLHSGLELSSYGNYNLNDLSDRVHIPSLTQTGFERESNKTIDVVVQNVTIHTTASTMKGVGADFSDSIIARLNQTIGGLV